MNQHPYLARKLFLAMATAGCLGLPSSYVFGQPIWDGDTNTTWSTGGNWDTGSAPTSGQVAVFSAPSPINQPTVTANTSITGLTFTVNPVITINNGVTLTATGVSSTTGAAGVTLRGAGSLAFTATGSNLNFGSGTITLDGGGFSLTGSEVAINTTTGLPTGNRTFNTDIAVTSNGGRLALPNSGTANNATVLNTLTLGGALTTTSAGGGNADGYVFSGNVTLQQDGARTLRITNNTGHNGSDWISGRITDGAGTAGNALRLSIAGRGLQISNGTNDYAGGTIVEAASLNNYSFVDVLAGGTLGSGNLTVESGGRIRLNNATASGVAGNLAGTATIAVAAGGVVGVNGGTNISDRLTASSAGVYGIEGTRGYAIDQSAMGNGRMFLGTVTGGTFNGTTLAPGLDNTYRLGGGSSVSTLTGTLSTNILTISGANVLTGNNKLVVGSGLNTNASAGRVVMSASQDFVGDITINSDGLLATSIVGGTPFGNINNAITVHGSLAASGANGVFNNAIYSRIDLRPGSSIVLNNNLFNNTAGGNNNDRWLNSQGVTLNGATFSLQGARSADTSETIGAVTFNGNSRLQLVRNSTSPQDILFTVDSITRQSGGTMAVVVSTGGMALLGADTDNSTLRVVTSGTAPTLLNGGTMVSPFLVGYEVDGNGNAANGAFLTYNSNDGVNVSGTRGFTGATFTSSALNSAGATDIVNAGATTLGTNPSVYALRVTGAITQATTNTTVTIGSGSDAAGLIDQSNGGTHTAIFNFGAREAVLWKLSGNTTTYNGIVTSGGLTKSGAAAITLASTSNNISGGVIVNQGTVNIGSAAAATDMADNLLTVNHEGTFNLNDNNVTVAGLAGSGRGANVTNGGANARTLTLDFASGTRTYDGRLQGTGTAANLALVKTGNGTQVFGSESVASYTGTTQVNGGALRINGNFSGAIGAVTVGASGTLGGSGTIGGATTVLGTLAPGNSAGNLTFTNGLTISGTYEWELSGLTTSGAGVNFDTVTVTAGGVDITGGSLSLVLGSFAPSADSFWASDKTWTGIINNLGIGSISGTSLAINNSAWSSLGSFSTIVNGNDLDLRWTAAAIPEPSAFAIVAGAGVMGFAASRRRRRV